MTLPSRAREIASLSTVSSQPHVWEAMKLLVEMAEEIERLRGETASDEMPAFLCVECGPSPNVDEDGCCASCGGTAMGTWLDKADHYIARTARRMTKLEIQRDDARADVKVMIEEREVLRSQLHQAQSRVRELEVERDHYAKVYGVAACLRQFPVPFDDHWKLVGAVDECRQALATTPSAGEESK